MGMTTCPRSESYIQESLNSLIDKGWGVPLIYDDYKLRGDWWGFIQVCKLLLDAYPAADRLLILQDDAIACFGPDAIEECVQYSHGVCSLFTMHQSLDANSITMVGNLHSMKIGTDFERKVNCNGGIAFLIDKWLAGEIVDRPYTEWTPTPRMIGEFCYNEGYLYKISDKNIFEHIGETSSLHPDKPDYRWDVSPAKPFRG